MTFTVLEPGALTLVQDLGRPGLAEMGVGPSGAFDRRALAQARALVGDHGTAGLEVLGGGLRMRAGDDHVVAVTGAVGPLHIDGVPARHGRAVRVAAGQTLRLGRFEAGLRGYVAVAGGLDVSVVLGSRCTDTLAGLGPAPLRAGDVLRVSHGGPTPVMEDVPALLSPGLVELSAVPGPRDDWFDPASVERFFTTGWTVGAASDRIGVRLEGPALDRDRDGELPSEPCVRGCVQIAADGRPIVLGPDHPITGGYPVIAVVADAHTDLLAPVRPGDVVRFRRH